MNRKHGYVGRIMALLMALILTVGTIPAEVSAWVGPVINADPSNVQTSIVTQDGKKVAQLKNSYISFEIDAKDGTKCRTVPTKYYKDTLQNSIDSSIYQELQFYQDDTKLVPASVDAQTYGRNFKLVYTFKNSAVTAEVTFSLVEATNGKFRGRTAFPVRLDQYMSELYEIQDTHGKTWIVTASAVFKTNGSINAHFYMNLINHRLPVYGHEDISNPKRLVASQASWSSGTRSVQLLDISAGISKKYASDISEAGIVSYEEANPFVILGDIYDHLSGSYEDPLTGETRWGILSGVEGQSTISNGAEYFAYTPPLANGNPDETADILTMWSNTTSGYVDGFDRLEGYSTQSWGFRNLYAEGEQVVPFSDDGTKIESNFGSMDTNAAMLAIIPDSTSATGYTVKELQATDSIPSNAVTVFRGTFIYLEKEKYYDFGSGRAFLSPTVSASYDVLKGGYFRVKRDGTILHKGITLSVPSFNFFVPKGTGAEPVFKYTKDKGLEITIDPNNNGAVVKVDIPYTTTKLGYASIKTNGDIVFSGSLHILTVFDSAKFQLHRMSFGNNKKGKFTFNGIDAEIHVEDVDLFGLEINKADGNISTFPDNEHYDFEVSVNAFDVFKFAAELELKRTNDGTLMPNKLSGTLVVPKAGLPLVPPAPIVEVNGGEIGFDNLVTSLNGDYIAIPPFKVTLKAYGKIVKVVQGNLAVIAGPTGLQVIGDNLKIPDENGLNLIEWAEVHFFIEGMKRTYQRKEYTGINLNGGLSAKINVLRATIPGSDSSSDTEEEVDKPSDGQAGKDGKDNKGRDWSDVIIVGGNLELNAFGGTRSDASGKQLYLLIDTTGRVQAAINLPKFFPVIGGKNVGTTSILFSIGAQTLADLNGSTSEAFSSAIRNLNGYMGVCWKAGVLGYYARVYYVSPRTIGGGVYHGDPGDVDFGEYFHKNQASKSAQAAPLYDDNGDQIGIVYMEEGSEEQDIIVTSPDKDDSFETPDENAAGTETDDAEEPDEENDGELTMTAAVSHKNAGTMKMMASVGDDIEITDEDSDDAPEAEVVSPEEESVDDTNAEEAAEESDEETDEEVASGSAIEEGAEEGAEEGTEAEAADDEISEETPEEEGVGRAANKDAAEAEENTFTVTLGPDSNVKPGDTVVLEIKPAEGVTSLKTQFLEGLRIDDMPVTEIEMDDEGQNSNGGNVLFKLGEDDETVMAAYLFLDNTKTSWTIHSDVLLSGEPRLMTSSPDVYERLKDVSFDGTTLHATAANLEEDVCYELHTYMGREPGSAEYTVDTEEAVTEIPTGSDHYDYTVNVPTEGMAAESGDYYVSTALLKIIRDDFNGDGTISEDEVAQVALDRWESDSTFYYRNTNVPDAPQNAGIEAGGNETLTCTFGEVGNADGYRLRIYKDGKDTGYGYDFPVLKGTDPETGDAIDTLDGTGSKEAVTHKDGVYTVCVAPTVGGQQMADDADGLAEILQPGSGYMLGVSAYRYVDQEEKQYPLYSEETLSNEAEILPYQEAELIVKVNGKAVEKDPESCIYEAAVSENKRNLEIEVVSGGDYRIEAVAENDSEGSPFALSAEGNALNDDLETFDGVAMYDIVVTNKATKDRTAAFLRVSMDNVPPSLLLDADNVFADKNGNYTISGTTDTGVTVNGMETDEEGRFTLTGEYTEQYGILKQKKMSYEGTNTNPHNLVTEDDLNDLIQFLDGNVNAGYIDSYSIEPAAWSGSGEYTVTTVYTDVQPYSDTGFTTLQEEEKNGNIRNLKWFYDESEVTGDALSYYQDYLDSSYQELTPMKRATVGMSNYTVTAKDESGNETQATVFIWSHRHNLKSVAAVPGDCVHTGTKAYYICTGCGEKFEDASGTIPAGDLTTPVQANNHSYGGWKQTKNPTALSEGVNTRVCSRCGHAENRAVAKLPAKIALSVGKIKVDKTTVPLKKGQSFAKITAVMTTGDKLAEATSNKPKVVKASVNASTGKVTLKALKKTGKATITVKTAAGATTIFKVKVQKKKVVAKKIVGFKKKLTLKKGRKYKIPADVSPVSTPDRMKFKSAKKNIAAVSKKGIITAKKKGKATITVTIGKKKFKCIVTVK